jgi:hypothetical protein
MPRSLEERVLRDGTVYACCGKHIFHPKYKDASQAWHSAPLSAQSRQERRNRREDEMRLDDQRVQMFHY